MHHLLYKLSEPGQEGSVLRLCHETDLVLAHQDLNPSDRNIHLPADIESCLRMPVRVKAVGPVVMRRAACDDVAVLNDGRTVPVRAGDTIVLNTPQLHRDEGEHPSIVEMKIVVACLRSRFDCRTAEPLPDVAATSGHDSRWPSPRDGVFVDGNQLHSNTGNGAES